MIRLIVIRIFESVFRNFYLIIAPAIIAPLIAIALQLIQQPSYLSGATLQIRYNDEISKVIGYEKFATSPLDPSERAFAELSELMNTDAFVDRVLERVDFSNERGVDQLSSSQRARREFLRDNVEFQIAGLQQIGMIAYMPTESAAQAVITAVYEEYIIHQITTFGGSGRDLVEFMTIYLEAKTEQKDQVQNELETYLLTHPEDPNFDRRDIEESQIAQLTVVLDDLIDDIEYTKDVLDLGLLVENTSERYFRETFLLLDDPFDPISMTSVTQKISNIIQGTVVGVIFSILIFGGVVLFDRRIILPLDLRNTTDLPLLSMVPMEPRVEDQQTRRALRNLDLSARVRQAIKERMIYPARNQQNSTQENRNLNSAR